MSSHVLKGPPDQFEQGMSVTASPPGQRKEDLLEEFAFLLGTNVSALQLFDKTVAPQAPQVLPRRVISMDRVTKLGESAGPLGRIDDALSPPAEAADTLELHHNVFPGPGSASNQGGMYSGTQDHEGMTPGKEIILASRKSGGVKLTLGVLVAIGLAGLVGSWALNAAPRPPDDLANLAADRSKVLPPTQEAASPGGGSAPILPRDQAAKPSPVNLDSNLERSTELEQQVKPSSKTPSPAPRPEPSSGGPISDGGPVTTSTAPITRPISAPAEVLPVPAAAVGQAAAPGGPGSLPEAAPAKAGMVPPGHSVTLEDSKSPADTKASPRLAESPALPAPGDAAPQPVRPPVPVARPSFSVSGNGATQATARKVDALAKSSSKSVDRAPVPKAITTTATPSRAVEVATVPAAVKSPSEPATSADSLLLLVPNLFDKGVSAVRGFVGDASRDN